MRILLIEENASNNTNFRNQRNYVYTHMHIYIYTIGFFARLWFGSYMMLADKTASKAAQHVYLPSVVIRLRCVEWKWQMFPNSSSF